MTIINSSREMTAVEMYRMTKNQTMQKMSNMIGSAIAVEDWVIFEDTDSKGNTRTICSIKDKDGDVYATNSPTFIRAFEEILDIVKNSGENVETIIVVEGTSKAGRNFITCAI